MRITYNVALVLQAIASGCRYGFSIMDLTGLESGAVYPVLRRLEESGRVRSRWEDEEGYEGEGRPRRRYYELTDKGERSLVEAREVFAAHQRIFGLPRQAEAGSGGEER